MCRKHARKRGQGRGVECGDELCKPLWSHGGARVDETAGHSVSNGIFGDGFAGSECCGKWDLLWRNTFGRN